ncbi:UNVERIFIED_CONTAM: hypothetical protein PYX00_008585 [Menopon gallinae]|uniref:DNA-directed RNA polymerase subunit n=1 Tax=Menopon gallinae TaxID=328185 RepID=A0AAW2HNY8_9NEOP
MTICGEMDALAFRLFTEDDIRKMSVLEVVTPDSFDTIGHPLKGGLYDFTLGPSGMQTDSCLTCKQTTRYCPGHFGHIELPLPVINPLFMKEICALIRSSCKSCSRIATPLRYKWLLMYQMKLINAGYVTEAQELTHIISTQEGLMEEHAGGEEPKDVLGTGEAKDIIVKDKILDFIKEKNICLDREVHPTKTSEYLRKQFLEFFNRHLSSTKRCPYCKGKLWVIATLNDQLIVPDGHLEPEANPGQKAGKKGSPTVLVPGKSRRILRSIWDEDKELVQELLPILKHIPPEMKYGTDLLYMNVILVTPPKMRPLNLLKGLVSEHQQSVLYKEIIKNCIIARSVIQAAKENSIEGLAEESKIFIQGIRGDTISQKLQHCWRELQGSVNFLLNADGKKPAGSVGLKQLIEKKEGALRKYVMGKRVNFAARSVITPDPNLLIEEIGVPEDFAKKLTYPVKANFYNINDLKKMVQNGPDVYPGATMVETENGSKIKLFAGDANQSKRVAVAKLLLKSIESGGGKIVHRHLLNGDVLLLNRQPTLHRPSIMAHRARILKGEKTLRMHYSNCKSYNADFDGDEMNAHFPQNEIARSEAYDIVGVRNNYLVPKDGTPLGGLIQDHIISGVLLTMRGQFFNRQDYYQLVYQGLSHCRGDIKLLPPTILKPKMLWSGKQIISTILINVIPKNKPPITLHSKAKIGEKSWQVNKPRPWKCGKEFKRPNEMSESEVIIRNGQLLCGVLDKQHYGATPYGLAHCLYELYGGTCSSKFLDSAGKLFTAYLQFNGFTLGIKDILINEKEDQKRDQIIEKLRKVGNIAAKNSLDLDEVPPDLEDRLEKAYYINKEKFRARLDQEYKKILDSYTNEINKTCLPRGLVAKFPKNNLQLMVTSGAKGSTVNTMQISCLLGQIELEGKRPPLMLSGRSLPSFKPFETLPSAGGYVDGRFMTGITPQDFFFHCMAGREGLIDTAVKTSRSGYLQRCLIKHLEGVTVCYDGTVRDHDGSVVQFAYGEDGMEVQKSTFFNKSQMDFLCSNRNAIIDDSVLQILKDSTNLKKLEKHKKRVRAWDDEWKEEKWRRSSYNGFALFSDHIRDEIREKYWRKFNKATGRCKASSKIVKRWNELDEKAKSAYKYVRPDPVTSKFNRNTDFGAITEKLEDLINEYLAGKSTKSTKAETVKNIINVKYMTSLSQPGESVGLLAAQSIGEPSTQMTLNTFHFAGRGEMNVTLGIPRLREILMTATKELKTPYMEIPLKKTNPEKMEKRGNKLKKMFQMVTLSDVLQNIEVREKLVTHPAMLLTYTMKFNFLPFKLYKKLFHTTPKDILKYMEKEFLITLCKYIRRLGKKYGDIIYESKAERLLTREENEEVEEEEVNDKSLEENRKKRSDSVSSSEEEEEGDDQDATAARRRDRHNDSQEYEEEEDKSADEMFEDDENEAEEENEETPTLSGEQLIKILDRENFVLSTFPMVKSYKFDVAKEEWCEMMLGIPVSLSHIDFSSILREICEKAVIYNVPNVKRAILNKNKEGNLALKTEGINLIEIHKYHKVLDLNKVYTNDIHEMARVYGIEAAARIIVNELKEVFSVYGITVNPRHLLLIADFMTHQGVFTSFSRMGMVWSASPLQQMTFETTVAFLKDALNNSKTDALNSPSSRIMVGKSCATGTGTFDLINEEFYSLRKKLQSKDQNMCNGAES